MHEKAKHREIGWRKATGLNIRMEEEKILKDARISDPYVDRRSGEDRRQVYDADYFQNGGLEGRSGKERRQHYERRKDYTRVSEWSSVCADDTDQFLNYLRLATHKFL